MDKKNEKIIKKLRRSHPEDNPEILRMLFDMARNMNSRDLALECREICSKAAKTHARERAGLIYKDMYWDILLWLAPNHLDSFMLYIEKNREPERRFYAPRRMVLKQIVDAIQELVDDELDELFISLPARVGKSGTLKIATLWVMLRDPDLTNLYCSYSNKSVMPFYNGILDILTDTVSYCVRDVFPDVKIYTNAIDGRIDIGKKRDFSTLTVRSIDAALNGSCDVKFMQIADDTLDGISSAKNPELIEKTWDKLENDFLPRAVGDQVRRLWCGTRWHQNDPIGRRIEMLETLPDMAFIRYKVINIPALDPVTDESNFVYQYGLGRSTQQLRAIRASFDHNGRLPDWFAQYQGDPTSREGALFPQTDLNYYNGELPDMEPDRVFFFLDPSFGGGDFTSMPVAYEYTADSGGRRIYIHDVVFDSGNKRITIPKVVDCIYRNNCGSGRIEQNNGGEEYAEKVIAGLADRGYRCNITTRYAPTTTRKENRIYDRAPEIRDCYFRDKQHRTPEYQKFMLNLHSFVMEARNPHDDAPDSMAGLMECMFRRRTKATVFDRGSLL